MADETKAGEMPQTPEQPQVQAGTETVESLKAEIEALRKANKATNAENADRRKKLEAFEKAQADREQAEMTEAQKLKLALDQATSELSTLKTNETKRRIAAELKLPEALALRIQGTTEEDMRADAKALLEALPKPAAQNPGAANPGTNGSVKETREQLRERLLGRVMENPLSGGGVVWRTPPTE